MEMNTKETDFEINVREIDIDIRNEIKIKEKWMSWKIKREINEVEGDQV